MASQTTELQAIRDTINLYINGVHTGDLELLRKAFHPKAMMYGSSPNAITVIEIEGLFAFVAANKPPSLTGDPHRCFINSIQYADNAASVEMVEEAVFGHDYINFFQLLKIDGKWLIVSKTYNSTPATN